MVVGKLVLRDFAGSHGPKGNFTVLYDGDGELDFRLAKYHIFYHGKGIKNLMFSTFTKHKHAYNIICK